MINLNEVEESGWNVSPTKDYWFHNYKGNFNYQLYWQDNGYCEIFDENAEYVFRGIIEMKEELAVINKCVLL